MKREFALLLALCTFATAMVPRERRAVDTDSATESAKNICAATTPCGWSFYNAFTKIIATDVRNTYCVCAAGFSCEEYEDDTSANIIMKRCKKI